MAGAYQRTQMVWPTATEAQAVTFEMFNGRPEDDGHRCDHPRDPDPDGPWEWVCDDCGRVYNLHVEAWFEPRED